MSKNSKSKKEKPKGADVEVGKKVPISSIAAVQLVVDLRAEINALRAEHPEVFSCLDDLLDRYNTAVSEAEKVVRAEGVTCGPFENFSVSVKYDAAKMYEELGEEMFLEVGGSMPTKVVYELDRGRVEAAIASGKIPEETLEHFRSVSRSYHKPDKMQLE